MPDRRGSQRLKMFKRLTAVSLHPPHEFKGAIFLMDVGYHGCQLLTPVPLKRGTILEIAPAESYADGEALTVCAIWSKPIVSETLVTRYRTGVEFVKPGNYWKINPAPSDWGHADELHHSRAEEKRPA